MLCHLTSILLGWLGPLIFWLIKKDEFPLVDDQGKEALNFQISLVMVLFADFIFCVVMVGLTRVVPLFVVLIVLGVLAGFAIVVCNIVFSIIGAIEANKGNAYRYPWCIRLIK